MLTFIRGLFKSNFRLVKRKEHTQLYLTDFIEKRIVKDDEWNNVKDGEIRCEYYDNNNNNNYPIAYIQYRLKVGQIGLIGIRDEEYRNKGIGKQMLAKAFKDIKDYGTSDTIWAVSLHNHPFWSNVWGRSFEWSEPAHPTVTGRGYSFKFKSS